MVKTYDGRCLELAHVFLDDEGIASITERDKLAHLLALDIQDAIETFLDNLPASSRTPERSKP